MCVAEISQADLHDAYVTVIEKKSFISFYKKSITVFVKIK